MANVLLVDPSEVAKKAMQGILARGGHRLAAVSGEPAAWSFLQQAIKVDLIFLELKLEEGGGLSLVQRLKADNFLKLLPIVVYASHSERDSVKRALELGVQNFLVKPYHDTDIFAEIKKATTNPWRQRHFEEETSFCKLMGLTPAGLHKMLNELRTSLQLALPALRHHHEQKAAKPAIDQLKALAEDAETAGAWGIVECLNNLITSLESQAWDEFALTLEQVAFADQLIAQHLNPNHVPAEFLTSHELNAAQEEQQRSVWSRAPAENRCPVVDWPRLQRELEALPGCPVIDSAAAVFQMAANGHPASLNALMDLVEKDPGLSAQMLIAANQLRRSEETEPTPLEDPRLAVGRLGELRLTSQAAGLLTAEERLMQLPPHFDWQRFWKFQTGVARMARYTCHYLELYSLEPTAHIAGLLHDIGKLLLLRLHPFGFQVVLEHARAQQVSLRTAERLFLGCTTAEMAAHFAETHGLPQRYAHVMRWIDAPADAPDNRVLVAVVSLARDLCRQNNVGVDGHSRREHAVPIEQTAEWAILSNSVFPSFNLRKFEQQVHAACKELKLELQGRAPVGTAI
jgi:CheY-like chemotaxis protein